MRYILGRTSWGRRHKLARDFVAALAETVAAIVMHPVVLGGEREMTKKFLKNEIQRIHQQYGISIREAKDVVRAALRHKKIRYAINLV